MEEEIHIQIKDNSSSIERILHPITYASWLLGVGVAHPRKCPKAITIIIRIIYMAVCSINVTFMARLYLHYIRELTISVYINCLTDVMTHVAVYYYIYYGIRQYNKWPELMDRLKELDQKIKKEISMNDKSIKIIVALAVFATFLCLSISVFYGIKYSYILPIDLLFLLMLGYVILAQSLINSFVFVVVVYVLYCRFRTINKLIGQLDKLSDVLALKIRRIRELHTNICDLVSMVNDIHSLHLLFCSMCCFIMTVSTLFQLYILSDLTYSDLMLDYVICIVFVMQFYLICWTCTLVREESNRTGRIIYEIILKRKSVNLDKHEASNLSSLEVRPPLEDLDSEQSFNQNSSHNLNYADMENLLRKYLDRECVTKEINDFTIQLQQYRVTFTACNFFEMNNTLFSGFVGMIITYLIIVSQLDRESDKDVCEKFYEDFDELKTVIFEIKNESFRIFSKGNQMD